MAQEKAMPLMADHDLVLDSSSSLINRSHIYRTPNDFGTLPPRPSTVSPVYDTLRASRSLPPFDEFLYNNFFGEPTQLDSETSVPHRPELFTDAYLYPTLTKNEYARLGALWYYTDGIQEDRQILKTLERIISLVKQSFTWELGIVGILDATTYTRLATVNLPLAILPRSECTCAHTVNQKPGTVLTLQDLSQDWRFQLSPHVELGGLRSYAATQIRLVQEGVEDVVLGSLCVASSNPQGPLTDEQKKALVNAADLVAGQVVAWKQARRLQDRQNMQTVLDGLRATCNHSNARTVVVQALQQRYPNTCISLVDASAGTFDIGATFPIDLECVRNGIWEDTETLELLLTIVPLNLAASEHPVRAVIGRITTDQRLLVVTSANMKLIFDETDVWFVRQCAQLISMVEQEQAMREALAARDKLLRSITHELRTPIHGILSSVDLLEEELQPARRESDASVSSCDDDVTSPNSFLRIIRQSGTQLMTTVNSILQLNSSTNFSTSPVVSTYDLQRLEEDVLDGILANYDEGQLRGLSIRFNTKFTGTNTFVATDADLVKELVKCLLFNAISATSTGVVNVTSTLCSNQKLMKIDIVDTGRGINESDCERVFQAFEKLDVNSRGVGVGLDLATKMATRLGGKILLVSSQPEQGSHFRIELPLTWVLPRTTPLIQSPLPKARRCLSTYYLASCTVFNIHLISHLEQHLSRQGMSRSETAQGSMIIADQIDSIGGLFDNQVLALIGPHLILHITSALSVKQFQQRLATNGQPHLNICITGPMYTGRLDSILDDAEFAFEELRSAYYTRQRDIELRSQNDLAVGSRNLRASNNPPLTPGSELDDPLSGSCTSRHLRALLVDDNSVNLAVLKSFCRKRHIPHETATDGNQAVRSYVEALADPAFRTHFTLILMDLQMPECDGVNAVRQIRDIEEKRNLSRSSIVMITGQDSVTDKTNSFDAGVDGFYVKPMSMKALDQVIAECFPQREAYAGRKGR